MARSALLQQSGLGRTRSDCSRLRSLNGGTELAFWFAFAHGGRPADAGAAAGMRSAAGGMVVEHGANIERVEFRYELRSLFHLVVTVSFERSDEQIDFESREPWDAAVLRLVGISKAGDAPVLEGFYALRVGNQDKRVA